MGTRYSIDKVVKVVNKFATKEVSKEEILDFLIEDKPNFAKLDTKERIIFATPFDLNSRHEELVEWSKLGWAVIPMMFGHEED